MDLFDFDENEKILHGKKIIIGTDEAGRGPAAGGVWAAAVCFKNDVDKNLFQKLNDSKKISPKIREELYFKIKENSFYSIKTVDIKKIEEINILQASLYAMKCAVLDVFYQIKEENFITLVDGNKLIKNFSMPQKFVVKGDSKSASIAAASILAKVERDRFMDKIHLEYPLYNWNKNKGYLTKAHIDAILQYGTTKYHRPSFLKKILKSPPEKPEGN